MIRRKEPHTNTTKQDIVNDISKVTGLTQSDTKIAVEGLLQSISDALCHGKSIEIRGFGTFYPKRRKARPARNPKTGEVILVHERFVPLFKFSAELKGRVEAFRGSLSSGAARAASSGAQPLAGAAQ